MATKITQDELYGALESLRPDADQRTNAWYIGRRETTLRLVLARASKDGEVSRPVRGNLRRSMLVGALVVALLGGGTAWALSNYAVWYTGGTLDGITCMTTWHDPNTFAQRPDQYGGPVLTADPIADCNRYADLTGKARIEDPVAVRYRDAEVVGPRAGLPADAVSQAEPGLDPSASSSPSPTTGTRPTRSRARELELENSLEDRVDGGNSQCWDADSGSEFARSELDRLQLSGWKVRIREQKPRAGVCAFVFVQKAGVVEVRTFGQADPHTTVTTSLSTALRNGVTRKCLSLDEAERFVEGLLDESELHWPTASVVDRDAGCTRVDLVYGGSQQVFLYGPRG